MNGRTEQHEHEGGLRSFSAVETEAIVSAQSLTTLHQVWRISDTHFMTTVDHEVTRFLTLLRSKIREQGFTQLEVQAELGWGRSYISQLLTRQKSLRVEQLLLILSVIGMTPEEFFADLYPGAFPETRSRESPAAQEIAELRALLHGLIEVLLEKQLVDSEDLTRAVARQAQEDSP
ncbi:MAG: helix-turn-helix transcriptional regulator [bacterium]|nr:helix-turn-helix transcriptional regulator [bacterium]